MSKQYKSREELAEILADRILLESIGSAASSGLVLTRRNEPEGASFISKTLQAALMARGALVLYALLERARPADLIISSLVCEAIQRLAAGYSSGVVLGPRKVDIATPAICEGLVGIGRAESLCSALQMLSEVSQNVIVLIVDDVQLTHDTAVGQATLFALKAARDEINSSKYRGLRIVLSGADQDGLARLCRERDQAFFCAPMIDLPI